MASQKKSQRVDEKVRAAIEAEIVVADEKWRGFRLWLSENPLTGFWSGVIGGVMLGTTISILML